LETLRTERSKKLRLVGGSAKYPYWNWLLASVLGAPLDVSIRSDSSVRGAALLGAMLLGQRPVVEDDHFLVMPGELPGIDEYFARFKEIYTIARSRRSADTN
jgi:xylulokinase